MQKIKAKELQKKIIAKKKNGWEDLDHAMEKAIRTLSDDYLQFLNGARTERTAVSYIKREAERRGFVDLDQVNTGAQLEKAGKVFAINKNKNIVLFVIGKKKPLVGINLCASHIDAPRIDIKQNPLYEDSHLGMFKTHYYGGIKKFQWFNIPLALHGIIIRKNGTQVRVSIGDAEHDPVFVISDLLPHLSHKTQGDKKIGDVFTGEHLNLIVGSRPYDGDGKSDVKERIKLNIMHLLNRKYDITEEDFNSAELELVPALKARYAGFDESLVAGYGQDDRICAFTTMQALFNVRSPERTAAVFMADKEEIGSEGITGMKSWYLLHVLGKLLSLTQKNFNDQMLRDCLFNTCALSADVDAAVDPTFKEVNDLRNAAFINHGIVLTKYTGHGGKYMASDANAEYVGRVRKLFNDAGIKIQFAQLGKVDEGGGGTVAKHLAQIGMEVIDCGPAILGMHSPYEISSTYDIYQSFLAYKVFLQKMR